MTYMGRPKGGKNKYWSKDEKLRIVKKHTEDLKSQTEVAKEEGISIGMLNSWIKKYYDFGEEGLHNKKKPGNPFAKFQNKKELTELESLQYENMKLKLENALLKKGLTLEEVVKNRKK